MEIFWLIRTSAFFKAARWARSVWMWQKISLWFSVASLPSGTSPTRLGHVSHVILATHFETFYVFRRFEVREVCSFYVRRMVRLLPAFWLAMAWTGISGAEGCVLKLVPYTLQTFLLPGLQSFSVSRLFAFLDSFL